MFDQSCAEQDEEFIALPMNIFVMLAAAGAATLYATGSLQIKRSLQAGAERRRAIAVTNFAMMLWSLPLF